MEYMLSYLLYLNFEFMLNNAFNDETLAQLTKESFEFFIHEPVTILPEQKAVLIGDVKSMKSVESLRIMRETDFFDFQNLIRNSKERFGYKINY